MAGRLCRSEAVDHLLEEADSALVLEVGYLQTDLYYNSAAGLLPVLEDQWVLYLQFSAQRCFRREEETSNRIVIGVVGLLAEERSTTSGWGIFEL